MIQLFSTSQKYEFKIKEETDYLNIKNWMDHL